MPELTPIQLTTTRLTTIRELALVVQKVTMGQAAALSEERRQAIADLLQDREVLQARIRGLETEDEGFYGVD